MATVLHDCRFAARTLRQQPAFTLVAVLTLALGIGANTAIFSIVSALIFKQPSIADAERVVAIQRSTKDKTVQGMVSYLELQDWRAQNRTFEAISAYKPISAVFVHDGKAERLSSLRVTANFLTFLNTNLARGRNFEPAEERRGAAPAVIISYGLWQSRFGGADSAIGSKLDLNGRPFEVIGILPVSFEFPLTQQVDLLTTVFEEGANLDERGAQVLQVIGRLKPGVGLEQAQADLSQVGAALAERYPQYNRDITPFIIRLDEHIVGTDVRRALWLLFGTVAFILLIACTNVTNLLLVRAKAREKELALRAALGAGKWQVARQLLVESLMLSLLAGGLASSSITAERSCRESTKSRSTERC
jgi:putative ABC transport system permease protein